DFLKHATARNRKVVYAAAAFSAAWILFVVCGGWNIFKANLSANALVFVALFGFLLGAIVAGVVYHWLTLRLRKLDSLMPIASMFGIVYFTLVTTAAGRENLMKIGGLLFLAAAMHNAAGYFFGYWLSRAARLDKNSARSIAFEVGLQ